MLDNFSLITDTPAEGLQLAVHLTRGVVSMIQPDEEVQNRLREEYAEDSEEILEATHTTTVMFGIIAAANNYWRS